MCTMNKWNELCYILFENLPSNISEQLFELKVVQAFEKLGWSQFNNEIIVRESIQLGASNRITPDLILKSKEKGNLFIVEVKKPSIEVDNLTFKGQLSSYMGILRLDIGILIGNKIQVFIDGKFFNKNDIVVIEEIEFKRENEKGLQFIELFSKENFNKEKIEKLALEKIQQLKDIEDYKKLKNELFSKSFDEKIKNYLKTELLTEYQENIIDNVFTLLEIKLENKNELAQQEKLINTTNKENRVLNNSINSIEINGKLPIGKYVRRTFEELIKENLIDSNEIEKLQSSSYSKVTFDIQFPFLVKKDTKPFERLRYWKNPYEINGDIYFACSQWYEVSINNDRPYYEAWLKKMKK